MQWGQRDRHAIETCTIMSILQMHDNSIIQTVYMFSIIHTVSGHKTINDQIDRSCYVTVCIFFQAFICTLFNYCASLSASIQQALQVSFETRLRLENGSKMGTPTLSHGPDLINFLEDATWHAFAWFVYFWRIIGEDQHIFRVSKFFYLHLKRCA